MKYVVEIDLVFIGDSLFVVIGDSLFVVKVVELGYGYLL